MNKKNVISKLAHLSGISKLTNSLLNPKNRLTILAYHGVLDKDGEYKYNDGCVSCNVHDFERQMLYIKQNYNVVNFRTLAPYVNDDKTIDRPLLIITFDDGYANNYLNAFPILKKYGLTAVIFLITDYINTDRLFWFEELHLQLKCTRNDVLDLQDFGGGIWDCGNQDDIDKSIDGVSSFMKTLDNNSMANVLDSIRQQMNVPKHKDDESLRPLTWNEVKKMSDYGIEFGSHSATHPILSNVNTEQLRKEIHDSKMIIEKFIDKEVTSFSIPNGQKSDYGDREIKMIEKAGYKFNVNYIHGLNRLDNINKYDLNRLHIEEEHGIERFLS